MGEHLTQVTCSLSSWSSLFASSFSSAWKPHQNQNLNQNLNLHPRDSGVVAILRTIALTIAHTMVRLENGKTLFLTPLPTGGVMFSMDSGKYVTMTSPDFVYI